MTRARAQAQEMLSPKRHAIGLIGRLGAGLDKLSKANTLLESELNDEQALYADTLERAVNPATQHNSRVEHDLLAFDMLLKTKEDRIDRLRSEPKLAPPTLTTEQHPPTPDPTQSGAVHNQNVVSHSSGGQPNHAMDVDDYDFDF